MPRRELDKFDIQAMREGDAIRRMRGELHAMPRLSGKKTRGAIGKPKPAKHPTKSGWGGKV